MPRYNGFTCPKCGSHMFGTHTHHPVMGASFPKGTKVGSCHSNQYNSNGCTYQWNREDPEKEHQAIYQQTLEEWMEYHSEFLRTPKFEL